MRLEQVYKRMKTLESINKKDRTLSYEVNKIGVYESDRKVVKMHVYSESQTQNHLGPEGPIIEDF